MASSGPNVKAGKFWHQGFGTIRVHKQDVVPFMRRETAVVVALRATDATKIPMIIVAVQDFWGYRRRMEM